MASFKLFYISATLLVAQIFLTDSTIAAPSSVSFADDSGAYASAGDGNTGTIAVAGPSGAQAGTGLMTRGGTSSSVSSNPGSSSSMLLTRSGGSGSGSTKMQSMAVGSNGGTTILQQNGDQPAKVYTIPGSG